MKLWKLGIRLFKGVGKSRVYHFAAKTTKKISKTNRDGYYKFIDKWGMTSKTFTDKYLLRGNTFSGLLEKPEVDFSIKVKNRIKKVINSFK